MEKEVVLATGVAVLKPSVLRTVILTEASRQVYKDTKETDSKG